MFQVPLINQVVEWERRLEIEEERRRNLRGEPFTDFTTRPQPRRKERRSIFAWIFRSRKPQQQPAYPCCSQETRCETQPG